VFARDVYDKISNSQQKYECFKLTKIKTTRQCIDECTYEHQPINFYEYIDTNSVDYDMITTEI
jgi:hypothetical protein